MIQFPRSQSYLRDCLPAGLVAVLLAFSATSAFAHWPDTNATKWVQFPDPKKTGYDVLAAQMAGSPPLIVADDFLCRKTGPLTDIHIWTSWLGDTPNPDIPITLMIWSDVPAITNGPVILPSHPGERLWAQTFGPFQYSIRPWQTSDEQFWSPDPFPLGTILGLDHMIWQYNFYPTNPFVQLGTATKPIVYWLSVTAGANNVAFGWKTSTNHWNDDAVFGHLDAAGGQPVGDWKELRDPQSANGRSLDMSFALTTADNPPPPPPTNKWVQFPDQFTGLDIKATAPNIVADDFLCREAGTITNIQVWASWIDDATPNPNLPLVLSIWSDVPPTATTANASHPGTLLWTETFLPGSYTFAFYTNGTELFYDPTTGQVIPETKIWLYNFNPKQPFCQRGSSNNPVVYWLSVSTPAPITGPAFGWKTSTNHWNDDAVFGHVTATGTAIGDWKELFDPRTGNSLDLAFRLNGGPPTSDCNPIQRPKWAQWPDPSDQGLDVHATTPRILGDDFLCRIPGPISGVRVWGSWLNDKVDTNVTFQLSLWTDVPGVPGTATNYSHPGKLLCTTRFLPPHTVGTSVQRYQSRLFADQLRETFYDPDLPGTSGFIGNDTQIWQYDFFPRFPCWRQAGRPAAPRTYWITLTAFTAGAEPHLFGWKTSTNHWNDDGVTGHINANGLPLEDWKDLRDPRTDKSLDLSFQLRNFPIVGINKDLKNTTQFPVDGVVIVVAGVREITFHYDDVPPWPNFDVTYAGGNTILKWSGKTVAPGEITHVGFEMGGTSLSLVTMQWLAAGAVVGTPIQVNHHSWGNGSVLTLANDFAPGPVVVTGGQIEFYDDPVPLDQMNPGAQRSPLSTVQLNAEGIIRRGGILRVPLPPAPPGAMYAMFLLRLSDPAGLPATVDFLQVPLDAALRPAVGILPSAGRNIRLSWPSIPDRIYHIQMAPNLAAPNWMDLDTELLGDGSVFEVDVPLDAGQNFYRVMLMPE